MECFDNGFSQISWGGTFTLDFHPDMAEEHDPKDMRGELDLEITLSVPRSMILRESSWDERKRQELEEKRNHMTLDIHACDSWCHKSYKLRIGNNNPDFKWLAMVTAQRYTKTFAPRGRLRMREGGFGTTGKVAPYQVSTQLPPGMDRLQKEDDADVLHVGPETKLRDVLKDGDSAWVMFQNRKPHIVMAELATLQHDQHEVDEARRWLKRLCREDEVKIQIAIAEKFAELQRTQGKTILQMFEDFDEDGGGTIDHEELRDGFDMLGIELSDKNFTKMLAIWDESGDGEIDYEEFAEMFEKTQLMLEQDNRRRLIKFDVAKEFVRKKPLTGLTGPEREVALKKEKVENSFKLEESCFHARPRETDAKDWYDSKQTLVRACQADLSHAKRVRGLCQPGSEGDPEYEELRKALQRNYRVLFYTYKHYCSSDAQFGPFLMTWNAFTKFATRTGLIDKRNARLRDLDNIFIAVNAQSEAEEENNSKALTRFEFVEAVVRLAMTRYPNPDKRISISFKQAASKHIVPCFHTDWHLDAFRKNHLYTREVDDILASKVYRLRLRKIYKKFVDARASKDRQARNVRLLDIEGWTNMLKSADCFKKNFTKLTAAVAFAQSQMITVDEQTRSHSQAKRDTHDFATWTEFLEALVRAAVMHGKGKSEQLSTGEKLDLFLSTKIFPEVGLQRSKK
eukprot:g4880.t1